MPVFHENGTECFKGNVLVVKENYALVHSKGKFFVVNLRGKWHPKSKLIRAEVDAPHELFCFAHREVSKKGIEDAYEYHNQWFTSRPTKGKKVRTNYIRGPLVGFEGTVIGNVKGKSLGSARLVKSDDGKERIIESNRLEVIDYIPSKIDLDTFNIVCDALESVGLLSVSLIIEAYILKSKRIIYSSSISKTGPLNFLYYPDEK